MLAVAAAAALAVSTLLRWRLAQAWPLALSLLIWLPFLPGHIPMAFLLWQGPLEGVVWLLVAAGLIASRLPSVPGIFIDPARAPWIAGLVIAALAIGVFTRVPEVIPGGDEPHYLAATQSLIADRDLRVANNYAAGAYLDYFPGRLEPHFLRRAASGEIYSIHAPGLSAIVLPAFAMAGYTGAVITMIVFALLAAVLTWRLAWRVSGSAAGAWLGTLAVFATSPYFFHTFTIYPEIIGSFCVMCAVWLLAELDAGHDVSARRLVAIGAALAVLPWLHSRFSVLAGLFGVIILLRLANSGDPRQGVAATTISRIALFLSVPLVAGAAWFAFFWLIWGSPSPLAPYGADTSTSASYIIRGLIGLLIDQQFGVASTAPVYLMALAGPVVLGRRRPRLAIELSVIAIAYALTAASYAMWWAGSAAPGRFLVAMLPLAALPIAMLSGKASPLKPLTILLLLISVALVIPRGFVEGGRFIFNNRGSFDATLEWLSQTINLAMALPSVHQFGGSQAMRDAAVWLAGISAVALATFTIGRRQSIAARLTIASMSLAAAVMVSASAVWAFHTSTSADKSMVTVDRSKLAALTAFRPAWQSTTIDVSGWRRISEADFLAAMPIDLLSSSIRLNRVPAGEYELLMTAKARLPVSLAMFVGRNDPPIEAPPLDQLSGASSPFRLRLPVALRTLNFATKEDNGAGTTSLTLRPIRVTPPASGRYALRAARYGHARAFFFDEQAYLERDGFWTRGDGRATVVLDTDDAARWPGLPISITAGAVATTVSLAIGDWQESLSLTPGQQHALTLPPSSSGVWELSIRSGAGFRPSEREPGSRDVRWLSAWIAIR